ncbi:MAG: type II toxin-antitoxin system VapC family toxin [Planctomycetota bacterium]|jgi:predicted nucleic acid-binding protein
MVKLFVDSSALAKKYIYEYGSEKLEKYLQEASQLAISVILVPEVISGLNRRVREKKIAKSDYKKIKTQLFDNVRDSIVLQLTPSVMSISVKLLELNKLRAMDSLHIACALEWKSDIFVTADKQQYKAAKNAGLDSKYIGSVK